MKKIWILVVLFLLAGCSKNNDNEYYKLVNELQSNNHNSTNLPFSVNISIDRITDDEVMYNVIIDDPIEDIKNIKALVIHNQSTEDVYPSIGIFDSPVNLIPNKVDEKNNIVKGIALVGYLPFNGDIKEYRIEFKVLVEYTDKNGNNKKVYYINKM